MTHTYAELAVSEAAYAEVAGKLRDAGYDHAFLEDGVIDMQGIGVTKSEPRLRSSRHTRINFAQDDCLARCYKLHRSLERAFSLMSGILAQPAHSASEEEARLAEREFEQAVRDHHKLAEEIINGLGFEIGPKIGDQP